MWSLACTQCCAKSQGRGKLHAPSRLPNQGWHRNAHTSSHSSPLSMLQYSLTWGQNNTLIRPLFVLRRKWEKWKRLMVWAKRGIYSNREIFYSFQKREYKLIFYLISLIIFFHFIMSLITFENIGHFRFKTQNFELKTEMCSWCCRCVCTCIMINHVHTIASFTPHHNLPVRTCSLSIHCLYRKKLML